jgi:hypothetical protein
VKFGEKLGTKQGLVAFSFVLVFNTISCSPNLFVKKAIFGALLYQVHLPLLQFPQLACPWSVNSAIVVHGGDGEPIELHHPPQSPFTPRIICAG